MRQIALMTIAQLKAELRRRRLKTTGNKTELVERFRMALQLDDQRDDDVSSDDNDERRDRENDVPSDDEVNDVDNKRRVSNDRLRKREKCLLTFKDVEDYIESFSGDDGKSIITTGKVLRRLLRGSARLFVKYEVRGKAWEYMKAALKSKFSIKIDSYNVHKALRERKKTDETYHEYCRMLEIAAQANVKISAVIQYIIDGIDDDETNKIILYGAQSISELKRKFDTYEAMRAKWKVISKTDNRKKKSSSVDNTKRDITDKRCFNCGGKNHLSVNCATKAKGIKCFQCGVYGHIAAKCSKTATAKDVAKDKACNAMQSGGKKCYKVAKVNGCERSVLVDTGSDLILIRADCYVQIDAPPLINRQIKFRGVGSSENTTLGEARVNIKIDNDLFEITLHVVLDTFIMNVVLIGMDFLNNVEMCIKKKTFAYGSSRNNL